MCLWSFWRLEKKASCGSDGFKDKTIEQQWASKNVKHTLIGSDKAGKKILGSQWWQNWVWRGGKADMTNRIKVEDSAKFYKWKQMWEDRFSLHKDLNNWNIKVYKCRAGTSKIYSQDWHICMNTAFVFTFSLLLVQVSSLKMKLLWWRTLVGADVAAQDVTMWTVWTADRPFPHLDSSTMRLCCCNSCNIGLQGRPWKLYLDGNICCSTKCTFCSALVVVFQMCSANSIRTNEPHTIRDVAF